MTVLDLLLGRRVPSASGRLPRFRSLGSMHSAPLPTVRKRRWRCF